MSPAEDAHADRHRKRSLPFLVKEIRRSEIAGCPPKVLLFVIAICVTVSALQSVPAYGSAYDFLRLTTPKMLFALDPDITVRKIDPYAPDGAWTLGEGWGVPPIFFHTKVPGLYDRVDFFYPLGCREESKFRSRLRFTPFFESYWSKVPPFDGFSRCLTLYQGLSDMGQPYWGFFPFYGFTYRRNGADKTLFVLFPLYSESTDDDARTIRLLWPFITYARSPGRQAFKIWPIVGTDSIRQEYRNRFVLWPFFQHVDKYPGTPEAYSYTAAPFPLYMRQDSCYSTTVDLLWPLFTYYHHYPTGHRRYSLRPLFTYGYGGGIDELSIFYFYYSKTDRNKGTSSGMSEGYISVGDDEVFTERKFLMMSSIQKRYRKGFLVFAKYKFWPFAEYSWDVKRGSHLKVPELISLKSDWWDLNLGRLLRFLDFRDTPLTREISLLSGLSQRTEFKTHPYISPPPKPGDDGWQELIFGSFGKR
ncbi:MAG TPA: hypothetical protein VMC85_18390 [Desulfomonilaceae bacterium]|nr:hypothetical protein [Desulfomonilaceae bacterium]